MSSSPEMDAVMRPFLVDATQRLSDSMKVFQMEIHEAAADLSIDLDDTP